MTRFRALMLVGAFALTFNFAGCFDGGDQCNAESAAGAGQTLGGTTGPIC